MTKHELSRDDDCRMKALRRNGRIPHKRRKAGYRSLSKQGPLLPNCEVLFTSLFWFLRGFLKMWKALKIISIVYTNILMIIRRKQIVIVDIQTLIVKNQTNVNNDKNSFTRNGHDRSHRSALTNETYIHREIFLMENFYCSSCTR